MTKSELIEAIARKQKHLPAKDVELAVKHLRGCSTVREVCATFQTGQGSAGTRQREPAFSDQELTAAKSAISTVTKSPLKQYTLQ
jgi:hypothetical protein